MNPFKRDSCPRLNLIHAEFAGIWDRKPLWQVEESPSPKYQSFRDSTENKFASQKYGQNDNRHVDGGNYSSNRVNDVSNSATHTNSIEMNWFCSYFMYPFLTLRHYIKERNCRIIVHKVPKPKRGNSVSVKA